MKNKIAEQIAWLERNANIAQTEADKIANKKPAWGKHAFKGAVDCYKEAIAKLSACETENEIEEIIGEIKANNDDNLTIAFDYLDKHRFCKFAYFNNRYYTNNRIINELETLIGE